MHTSVFDPSWNTPRRKPRFGRLRNALRRWLGVNDLATEIENERGYVGETVNNLQADIRANEANDDMHISQLADLAARLSRVDRAAHFGGDALQRRIAELEMTVEKLQLATGGIWKTADGDVLMIRQMSDNHLQNAMDYPGVSATQKSLLRREIVRRHGDDQWHERYGKTSPRKLLARLSSVLRQVQFRIERMENTIGNAPIVVPGRLPNGNPTIEVKKAAKKAKRKS